jgi:uncharacterized protein (DUF58 family)
MTGLRASLQRNYHRWLDRRLPEVISCRLRNRRLFIFPSAAGGLFTALLVVLWLTATNFENNLIFGLTFLLAGLFVVTIFHTYANLHGIEVGPVRGGSGFAGESVDFAVALRNPGRRSRQRIQLRYAGGPGLLVDLQPGAATTVRLAVAGQHRGWLNPGRLWIESVYPLGIVRVWSQVRLPGRGLVFPRPLAGPPPAAGLASTGRSDAQTPGREDFAALSSYRPGESRAHIAWKQYARELGLYTKTFTDPVDRRLWLDWRDLPAMDVETRLSRLCGAALAADSAGLSYGLRLPDQEIPPDRGRSHRDRVLAALALYGLPSGEGG